MSSLSTSTRACRRFGAVLDDCVGAERTQLALAGGDGPRHHSAMPIQVLRALVVSFSLIAILLGCADGMEPTAPSAPAVSGEQVFADNCAVCHALPLMAYQVPQITGRPPGFVYDALTEGAMRRVGARLDEPSRRAVAEYFTGVAFGSDASVRDHRVSPSCVGDRARFDWSDRAHPSWGGDERNHRNVAGSEGYSLDDLEKLAVQWVVAFPEATQLRSAPTAAGGALFVGSHNGSVYALDQETGCTRWHFKAGAEVRSAVALDFDGLDAEGQGMVRAVFADRAANTYALNAETGELLWKQSVDSHPSAAVTGSVAAFGGRYFVPVSSNEDVGPLDKTYPCCTHVGAVVALDAESGEILWRTPTVSETPAVTGHTNAGTEIRGPSGASVWNTPTISERHGLLFVGSGNNHSRPATAMSDSILAMDLETGRVAWSYQAQSGDAWNAACLWSVSDQAGCPTPEGPDIDFGATTVLVEIDGRETLVAGAKSGVLHAFDVEKGELRWKQRISQGGPESGIRYGMATREGVLYVPSTDSRDDPTNGESARPGLYAVAVGDGAPLWSVARDTLCREPALCRDEIGAPPLAMEEMLFVGASDGILYALDRASGAVLWQIETAREFTTLLGTTTLGGSIYGTVGPVFANGRLFVSSGYGQAEIAGNALIAIAPE